MTLTWMKTRCLPTVAGVMIASSMVVAVPTTAYGATRDELQANYQSAVANLESAVAEQDENTAATAKVEADIVETDRKYDKTQNSLNETAVAAYKGERGGWKLMDLVLDSESFHDAVLRYDNYKRIEEYYSDKMTALAAEREKLGKQKLQLAQRKVEIQQQVKNAKLAADNAEAALAASYHRDGASFHQLQGNGSNCGATSFIVAVNTLLHENRYVDNVEVWNGAGFEGDSTTALAFKGSTWLLANGLADTISIETVDGDITTTEGMRSWLEQGYVIVTSSGAGSQFQRGNSEVTETATFGDGHWIMFYNYENGIYYANDSSVPAAKGAGVEYTEEQMAQWLAGRGNHFAVAMGRK